MQEICDDLHAEHSALDEILDGLGEQAWLRPTPAEGWDVKATVVHLAQVDAAARMAAADAEQFALAKSRIGSGGFEEVFGRNKEQSGAEILSWWRSERKQMLASFRLLGPKDRIPWFGPDMSALSFATARLMETWSHGRDVADTIGKSWVPCDRLRHVAHIGVSTRAWSYVNRGLTPPSDPVRVELRSPSGELWVWGPEDAAARVSGDAEDFCLLVTQRRHISASNLLAEGASAAEWLTLAQAFAGAPTSSPENRASSS